MTIPFPATAQETTASFTGTVTDATGLAVANVQITATHTDTGVARHTRTNAEGQFNLPSLPIGTYVLEANHAGFRTARQSDVTLHISDHIRVDFKLSPGDISQSVTVEENAALVSTETSEQSGLISGEQVRELQLNGRSFMSLIELLPGVSSDLPDRVDPNTPPSISINGARSSASAFTIDGGNNSDVIVGSGSLNTFTSVDTIAEFKVVTSTFAAEYGRGGFSQVNVVTRGGTRNFKGSLYHFLRNDALDARDFLTHQVLPLKLNNFGYNLHGPLTFPGYNKDRRKTFFFWTQEFNRIITRGEAINTQVPELAHRSGDFTSLGPGRDGAYGTTDDPVVDPETNRGFPNGRIPANRIDPRAKRLLDLYPAPNFRGPGALNYTSAAGASQWWREHMLRIDHNFSERLRLYGRLTLDNSDVDNPYGGWQTSTVGTRFPGINSTASTVNGRNVNINSTILLPGGWLSETIATYSARRITQNNVNPDVDRKSLGIDIPKLFDNGANTIPNIALGGTYAVLNIGRPWLKNLFNADVTSNLTKVIGKHVVKTGVAFSYGGNRENPTGPLINGQFTYSTIASKNAVANLLLGIPTNYSEAERLVVSHARFGMLEGFVQDDFRVLPRLTLNYGVRYSSYFNPWDTDNVLTNFLPGLWDPTKAPTINPANGQRVPNTGDPLNGVIVAGRNSPFGKKITNDLHNMWAPRFGFAWDPTGRKKIAIRGGYGINYTRPLIGSFINNAFDNVPFNRSVTILNPSFSDPTGGTLAGEPAPTLTVMGAPLTVPYVQQWGLGVERELAKNSLLKVSYVGNKGTHLLRPLNLNNPQPRAATGGVNVNAVRPYLGYGAITERQPTANSNYNSLQVSLNRRMTRQFSVSVAYTFSKSIDNASTDRGGSDVPPDTRNPRNERAVSDFDRTHILTSSYIYTVPRLMRNRFGGLVVNGWQISGITRINSGSAFDIVMSQDVANIGATQNQRPNLIAPVTYPKTVEQWFSVASFGRPASGTFGNLGRNTLRRPGLHRWDASLMKNFFFDERKRYLQFRAEFFNVPNHPSFTTIGTTLTTTAAGVDPTQNSFGVVTGTRDARVLQFGLKLYF